MKHIYEAVAARLKTEVPELNWIDLEKGQMNFERPPIAFPAALIQIQLPKTENLNQTIQKCLAQITVRFCFNFKGNTDMTTPETARAQSLSYFDIKQKGYEALQGYGTEQMNAMRRTNEFDDLRPDHHKVTGITFTTEYMDSTAGA